jgi:septum formation topological specificity factor MinE
MPTRPIDRLLFAQGGLCFFCQQVLSPADASVEHLVATSNGGSNEQDNCVACCKALNTLLGSMSLKEKLRVVLNQKGDFKCPNGGSSPPKSSVQQSPVPKISAHQTAATERLELVVADLRKRGASRPRTLKTLTSTVGALFKKKLTAHEVAALLAKLQSQGIVSVNGTKVTYLLPPTGG